MNKAMNGFHISKRRPVGDDMTGFEAAARYQTKHPRMGLQQIKRYHAILAGKRPFKFDVAGKREMKVLAKEAAE